MKPHRAHEPGQLHSSRPVSANGPPCAPGQRTGTGGCASPGGVPRCLRFRRAIAMRHSREQVMTDIDTGLNVWQMTRNHNRMIEIQADRPAPRDGSLEIACYGSSAFRITSPKGVSVMIDPYRDPAPARRHPAPLLHLGRAATPEHLAVRGTQGRYARGGGDADRPASHVFDQGHQAPRPRHALLRRSRRVRQEGVAPRRVLTGPRG